MEKWRAGGGMEAGGLARSKGGKLGGKGGIRGHCKREGRGKGERPVEKEIGWERGIKGGGGEEEEEDGREGGREDRERERDGGR